MLSKIYQGIKDILIDAFLVTNKDININYTSYLGNNFSMPLALILIARLISHNTRKLHHPLVFDVCSLSMATIFDTSTISAFKISLVFIFRVLLNFTRVQFSGVSTQTRKLLALPLHHKYKPTAYISRNIGLHCSTFSPPLSQSPPINSLFSEM